MNLTWFPWESQLNFFPGYPPHSLPSLPELVSSNNDPLFYLPDYSFSLLCFLRWPGFSIHPAKKWQSTLLSFSRVTVHPCCLPDTSPVHLLNPTTWILPLITSLRAFSPSLQTEHPLSALTISLASVRPTKPCWVPCPLWTLHSLPVNCLLTLSLSWAFPKAWALPHCSSASVPSLQVTASTPMVLISMLAFLLPTWTSSSRMPQVLTLVLSISTYSCKDLKLNIFTNLPSFSNVLYS